MKTPTFLLCTVAVVSLSVAVTVGRADDVADVSPELKVLDRGLGNWLHTCTNLKAEWTPKQTQFTITGSYTRILDGRFVQGKGKSSDGHTFLQVETYDAERKCYRRWFFQSNGHTSEDIGKWNPDTKTMTWSHSMGGNRTSTQTVRYLDANTYESSVLVKDRDGTVYYHLEIESARTE